MSGIGARLAFGVKRVPAITRRLPCLQINVIATSDLILVAVGF